MNEETTVSGYRQDLVVLTKIEMSSNGIIFERITLPTTLLDLLDPTMVAHMMVQRLY